MAEFLTSLSALDSIQVLSMGVDMELSMHFEQQSSLGEEGLIYDIGFRRPLYNNNKIENFNGRNRFRVTNENSDQR